MATVERSSDGKFTFFAWDVSPYLLRCPADGLPLGRPTMVVRFTNSWPLWGTPISESVGTAEGRAALGIGAPWLAELRQHLAEQPWTVALAFLCHTYAMMATALGQEELAAQFNTLGGALMVIWAMQQRHTKRRP